MRVIWKIFLVLVLAAIVFVFGRKKPSWLFPPKAGHDESVPQLQSAHPARVQAPQATSTTNPPQASPDGVYVREGDHYVYVRFANPSPVLGSYLQSLTDGSFDPARKGKQIFLTICAACHQRDGEGKDGVAPPLDGSEWVLSSNGSRLVRIALNGLTGPVRVRGKDWNLSMPAWRANLTDDQLAVVLTYIRSQLGGNHAGPITPEFVAAVRKEARPSPETTVELLKVPAP